MNAERHRAWPGRKANPSARAARKSQSDADFTGDSNEQFAYIAGYTPNGVSFGVAWEEWEKLKGAEEPPPTEPDPF